jgi:hypothetical protein
MDTTISFPDPKPLAHIEFPAFLAEWLDARSSEDPWLAGDLRELREWKEPWHAAVAAGRFMRLRELSREQRDLCIQRSLSGEVDPDSEAPRLWARGLSEDQLETLFDLAVATVNKAHDDIDHLDKEVGRSDETYWQRRLQMFLCERDDLESVKLVLKGTSVGQDICDLVEGYDDALRNGVEALPELSRRCEQLDRAGELDWWAATT